MTVQTPNIRVGTRLPLHLVQRLDAEAERRGITRQQFLLEAVRQRLTRPVRASGMPVGSQVFARAVEGASKASAGIPRTQLEAIVAAVICTLDEMLGEKQ